MSVKDTLKDSLVMVEKDLKKPTDEPSEKFCGNCGKLIKNLWFGENMSFLARHDAVKVPGWNQVPCSCLTSLSVDNNAVFRSKIRRAGIGKRFEGKTFDDYVAECKSRSRIIEIARNFASDFDVALKRGTWLFFVGNPGTGKTLLSCIIAQDVMKAGYSVLYVKARDVFRMVKESWRRDSEKKESEIIAELKAVDFLIIDEIGVQFGSDAERGILYDVLDGRYEDMKPLIATTNRGFEDLSAIVGEHNLDRFRDQVSDSRIMVFDWASQRSRK